MILGIATTFFIKKPNEAYASEDEVPVKTDAIDRSSLLTSSLVMFLVFSGLRMMAGSMITTFIVLYLQDVKQMSITLASLVASSRMLLGFIAAPLGGYMAARMGEKKWLLRLLTLSYVFLGLSIAIPNVIWFTGLYVASGFCNTLVMAARSSIMAKLSPQQTPRVRVCALLSPRQPDGGRCPRIGWSGGIFLRIRRDFLSVNRYLLSGTGHSESLC
jgi:MFS family permease